MPIPVQRFCLYDAHEVDDVLRRMARPTWRFCLATGRWRWSASCAAASPWRAGCSSIWRSSPGNPNGRYLLKVKRYADDLSLLHPHTLLAENPQLAALDLANTPVLVVDDVLY